jgi:hypothetical protein
MRPRLQHVRNHLRNPAGDDVGKRRIPKLAMSTAVHRSRRFVTLSRSSQNDAALMPGAPRWLGEVFTSSDAIDTWEIVLPALGRNAICLAHAPACSASRHASHSPGAPSSLEHVNHQSPARLPHAPTDHRMLPACPWHHSGQSPLQAHHPLLQTLPFASACSHRRAGIALRAAGSTTRQRAAPNPRPPQGDLPSARSARP